MDGLFRVSAVRALIRKELLTTLKDKMIRAILVGPFILYIILFGYVATFNLDYVPYALLDESHSHTANTLVQRIESTGIFERVQTLNNSTQLSSVIDQGDALLVVWIGQNVRNDRGDIQVIIDGRNSTTAQVAAGYLMQIVQDFDRTSDESDRLISVRLLYNSNNLTQWFILPALVVMLTTLQIMILSALSVAREREQGTFEQLLVTPYRVGELLLAKGFVPVVIGITQGLAIFLVDIFWFEIPFRGQLWLVLFILIIYMAAIVGVGLTLSAISKTMQQALLYGFATMIPMVMLSGLFAPVANMPDWMQYVTYLDPLRFAIEAMRRVYLADAGLVQVCQMIWPVVAIACITMPFACYYFRKSL